MNTRKNIFIAVFVVGLLLVLHYVGLLRTPEEWLRLLLLKPLSDLQGLNVQVADQYRFFKDKKEFFDSYNTCQNQLAKVQITDAQTKLLTQENEQLRKILSFERREKTTSTLAYVIGKEINVVDQVLIIDKGEKEGIRVGQPVVAGDGVLVGVINHTTPNTAMFRLISDNQSRIASTVLSRDHSIGVVEGGYGISLRMTLIPRDEIILVGDEVVSSGLEQNIPRGLMIGSVTAVENEPYQPFQQAIITPTLNLNKLTVVGILTNR